MVSERSTYTWNGYKKHAMAGKQGRSNATYKRPGKFVLLSRIQSLTNLVAIKFILANVASLVVNCTHGSPLPSDLFAFLPKALIPNAKVHCWHQRKGPLSILEV